MATIRGTDSADDLVGTAGNDTISGFFGDDTLAGAEGNDSIQGSFGADDISGGAGDDLVRGGDSEDTLFGDAGNDSLYGQDGFDTLFGGAGDDAYYIDDSGDRVHETAVAGGSVDLGGIDWVVATVNHELGAFFENLLMDGLRDLRAQGNALANWMIGNSGDNFLGGGDGADFLEGRAGDDSLVAGSGADTLSGGAGDDSYWVEDEGDIASEATEPFGGTDAGGTDIVHASATHQLGNFIEVLLLEGSAGISGFGNAGDNRLVGNDAGNLLAGEAGNDTLSGRAGLDLLFGGAGDDSYEIGDVGDQALEGSGPGGLTDAGGRDDVMSYVSFTLGAFIETLYLAGSSAIDGTGNALDNIIQGNNRANRLAGDGGDDRLFGDGGNDELDGGSGNDELLGGPGSDTYVVDSRNDIVTEHHVDAGGAHIDYGGYDTVRAGVSWALGEFVEKLELTGTLRTNGTGNALANTLVGNGAANRLSGAAGGDTLTGGGGADTLSGGIGRDRLTGGDGNDVFDFDTIGASGNTLGSRDLIVDFGGGDRIDLAGIDANPGGGAGNDPFVFIGTAAFSATDATGQLRYEYDPAGNACYVFASTDADANAEFSVKLLGVNAVDAADFVL